MPTETPPKPSANEVRAIKKIGGKSVAAAIILTAFVTSKTEKIGYKTSAFFMRFFIIPDTTENRQTNEIILKELNPAALTELTKL